MAEDWDLWAVVRSCYTPAAAAAANHVTSQQYPISVPPSLVFEPNNDNSFGRRNNGFEELDEVYRTLFANSSQPIINPLLGGFNHQKQPLPINPNSNPTSLVSILGGFNHQKQEPPPPHLQPMNPNIIPSTLSNSVFGNSRKPKTHFMISNIMDSEEEEEQKPQPINPNTVLRFAQTKLDSTILHGCKTHKKAESTSCERVMSYSVLSESGSTQQQLPPPPKKQQSRKHPQPSPPKPNMLPKQCGYQYQRKKRSKRTVVVEVEAENLREVDPWNWRKYGRKPIKTSPYPRNYYKCSSEGNKCQAKKYVEKSPEDPDKLMVSYSGEHHHPPPRRRNALSCTTRLKSSTTTKKDSCSNQDSVHNNVKIEVEDDEDEEDVLNSEDVFMGIQ